MLKSYSDGRWIKVKVLLIDNFDSFTYNLVDEFEKRNCEVLVYRNNTDLKIIAKVVKEFKPKLIVLSPGPSNPKNAGNSIAIVSEYAEKIPIFGVCLGMQCIVEALDGKVDRCSEIKHGKPSIIQHDGETIFKDLENPFQAGRYHSLASLEVPYCLEISARTIDKNIIMGVRHKEFPVEGVQFHPESILTPVGGLIIENLMRMVSRK